MIKLSWLLVARAPLSHLRAVTLCMLRHRHTALQQLLVEASHFHSAHLAHMSLTSRRCPHAALHAGGMRVCYNIHAHAQASRQAGRKAGGQAGRQAQTRQAAWRSASPPAGGGRAVRN